MHRDALFVKSIIEIPIQLTC